MNIASIIECLHRRSAINLEFITRCICVHLFLTFFETNLRFCYSNMPHTKHKKRKQTSKRIEVTGEDGWTRVTNTNTARRTPKSLPFATSHLDGSENPWRTVPEEGATKEKLRAKYDEIERQWLASDSCKALTTLLGDRIRAGGLQVDKCIVFGTSSFCGLRLGWIKNDVNAMCQLAVLRTMQVTIGTSNLPQLADWLLTCSRERGRQHATSACARSSLQ